MNWADETASDDELVMRVLGGDKEAFGFLIERHYRIVHRAVWQNLPPDDPVIDHEDACQEAWVRAYTRLANYTPCGRFGIWVARIATNYCIDVARRRKFAAVPLDAAPPPPDPAPGPEAACLAREVGDALGDAVATMTPHQAGAFLAVDVRGHDRAEACALLGIPLTTIKMRLFGARMKVRKALGGV